MDCRDNRQRNGETTYLIKMLFRIFIPFFQLNINSNQVHIRSCHTDLSATDRMLNSLTSIPSSTAIRNVLASGKVWMMVGEGQGKAGEWRNGEGRTGQEVQGKGSGEQGMRREWSRKEAYPGSLTQTALVSLTEIPEEGLPGSELEP